MKDEPIVIGPHNAIQIVPDRDNGGYSFPNQIFNIQASPIKGLKVSNTKIAMTGEELLALAKWVIDRAKKD